MALSNKPHGVLPDVAFQTVKHAHCLDWVGMESIALPIVLLTETPVLVAANVDIGVNVIQAETRGIHMSRLYLHLQQTLAGQEIQPTLLEQWLQDCIRSQEGLSSAAYLQLKCDVLLNRPALKSPLAGWKRYPIEISAQYDQTAEKPFQLTIQLGVEYSSTCPASAALSRQLNARAFVERFSESDLNLANIEQWLSSEAGLAATPHAQRSLATVSLTISEKLQHLPWVELVNHLESALKTPVQTAVKRADEQAFAQLNAENLMFCEDAARRLASSVEALSYVEAFDIHVAHFESLHPHNAVARIRGKGAASY